MAKHKIPAAPKPAKVVNTTADFEIAVLEPEVVVKAPEITPAMQVAAAAKVDSQFASLHGQPMVKIRVPKVNGPQVVIINGARFNIPSNIFVEVPEQIAQILAESERI